MKTIFRTRTGRTIAVLLGIMVGASCSQMDSEDPKDNPLNAFALRDFSEVQKDPFTIEYANVYGDDLVLKVTYSGGCEEHSFRMFSEGPLVKTQPPGADVFICHDAKGDLCEALVHDTLRFDLSGVRAKGYDQMLIFVWACHEDSFYRPILRYTY